MTTTPTYWVGAMISVCHNSSGLPPSVFGGDGGGSGRGNERTNRVGVRPGGHPQKSPWGSFCETNGDVEFSLLRVQIVLVNGAKYKMLLVRLIVTSSSEQEYKNLYMFFNINGVGKIIYGYSSTFVHRGYNNTLCTMKEIMLLYIVVCGHHYVLLKNLKHFIS